MKRVAVISIFLFLIGIFSFLSCNKNKTNSSSPSPSTTAATNSTMTIGGSCWTYDSCNVAVSKMKGVCGTSIVELYGGGPSFSNGNYAFTSGIPTAGQVQMKITNPPSQLPGIWYSASGNVTFFYTTSGMIASFTNINCLQSTITNPTVTATGTVVCY